MGFRFTGVLLVVFLALLGYLYFFEIRGADDRRSAAARSDRVLDMEENRVVGLALVKKDSAMVFEKRQDGWWCLAPIEARGDSGALSNVIQALQNMDRKDVVATAEEVQRGTVKLADFGLDDPGLILVIRQRDAAPDSIYWGGMSPTGKYGYVQRSGRGEILMVNAWIRGAVDRSLFQLRDKRVLAFDRSAVKKIEMIHQDEKVVLVKEGEAWGLKEPVEERVDAQEIKRLLNRLYSARMQKVVSEGTEDLEPFGFSEPELVLSIYEGEKLVQKTVRIGARVDQSRFPPFYAKDADGKVLFTVDSTFVKDVRKRSDDLRFKRIFTFDSAGLDRMTLAYGDSLVVCMRDSSGEWFVEQPLLHFVLGEKVYKLVRYVELLEPSRFVAELLEEPAQYGFDRPALVASFYRGDELLQEIMVGERNRHVYLVGHTRPQVVEIDPNDLLGLKLEMMPIQPEGALPDTVRLDAAGKP
ncbi:MAG: DUF4340 domain-containing protein [bacterium]|nr:DUF4340 domain-containing protein [bacterium]